MKLLWQESAWEEYLHWQSQDKKTLRKINKLLTDINRNGYQCSGKPEPLKGDLGGYWSVRIDEKNRIVFRRYPIFKNAVSDFSINKSLRKIRILAILCWCQLTDTRFCILGGLLPY